MAFPLSHALPCPLNRLPCTGVGLEGELPFVAGGWGLPCQHYTLWDLSALPYAQAYTLSTGT